MSRRAPITLAVVCLLGFILSAVLGAFSAGWA